MAEAVAVAAPPAKKKGGRGKLLVIIGIVVALGAGAFVGLGVLGGGGEEAMTEAPPEEGAIVTVASMTTSLSGSGTHFARVEFAAVLSADANQAMVEERFPLLKDAALSVIMSFDMDALRTPAGADRLRAELTDRAQELYPDGDIVRVILTDLLVQ